MLEWETFPKIGARSLEHQSLATSTAVASLTLIIGISASTSDVVNVRNSMIFKSRRYSIPEKQQDILGLGLS